MNWSGYADRPYHLVDDAESALAPWKPIIELRPDDRLKISFVRETHVDAACAYLPREDVIGELSFLDCDLTDDGLAEALSGERTGLRESWVQRTQVTGKGLSRLAECPNLECLAFSGQAGLRELCQSLAKCKTLQVLWLEDSAVTDEDLRAIGPHSGLQELNLNRTLAECTTDVLLRFPELRKLYCDTQLCSDATLAGVSQLHALERLELSGRGISDRGLDQLVDHPTLSALMLFHTSITDAGLATIACVENLSFLWLDDTPIDGSGIAFLRAAHKLLELDLGNVAVQPAAIRQLSNSSLQGMSVSWPGELTPELAQAFCTLKQLNRLTIEGNLSPRTLRKIERRLPNTFVMHLRPKDDSEPSSAG